MSFDRATTLPARPVRRTAVLGIPRLWACQAGLLAALCLSALTERIPLPFTPVPFTLQVFVVFLAALFLGGRRSIPVVMAYLAIGAAGLPVYSGGGAGLTHLFGATGGYLFGFVFAASVVGAGMEGDAETSLSSRGSTVRIARDAGILALGLLIIYGLGALWFWGITGVAWSSVLALTVYPFVALDVVKVATAYSLYRALGRRVRRFLS